MEQTGRRKGEQGFNYHLGTKIRMQKVSDIPEDGIMFYDIETDSQYCQYCNIKLIAYQVGLHSEPLLVEGYNREDFRRLLASNIMKVSFNGINFDDVVLMREGYYVNPENRHDMYLAVKTVAPDLPAYGLKYLNNRYSFKADDHEPERQLHNWMHINRKSMWEAPEKLLAAYCKHDVKQTCFLFKLVWEIVQRPDHWEAYTNIELGMGEALHEMTLYGGEYVDTEKTETKIAELGQEVCNDTKLVQELSAMIVEMKLETNKGYVPKSSILNPMSNKQVQDFYGKKHVPKAFLLGKEDYSEKHSMYRPWVHNARGIAGGVVFEDALKEDDEPELIEPVKEEDNIRDKVKKLIRNVRENQKVIGYLRSYCTAANYERQSRDSRDNNFFVRQSCSLGNGNSRGRVKPKWIRREANTGNGDSNDNDKLIKIPKSYSMSRAITRRFTSSSQFGINFQNQNKKSKIAQAVPQGWLGVYIDSTQIENVVHIWASEDRDRRKAYEADKEWNEYVWLSNQVLGTNYNKATLEEMTSDVNPTWTVYKQYKSGKLALNFGMGVDKFMEMTGLSKKDALITFAKIHKACPAIHRLQEMVRKKLLSGEKIRDPFGHIYAGTANKAYKVVSYLIQGCGTGSVPKAMIAACYNTLHLELDSVTPIYEPNVYHPYKRKYMYGVVCGTTHDEISLRISLGLPTWKIVKLIKDLMYDMEGRFQSRFAWNKEDKGIELRAKLAVSLTTAADQIELNHRADDFKTRLVREYIEPGKRCLKNV